MNKKIIAIVFIALFTVSLGVVLFYPPPTQGNVGSVNVSRGETYWRNEFGNTTEARYLVDYGLHVLSDTPKVTVTDKTD
ncbi:MAG: hypothetical protein WC941_04665, partial [Candidatus Bathyarchaeia archaeon]